MFALTAATRFRHRSAVRGSETCRRACATRILARRRALPATRHVLDFVSVIPSRAEIDLLRAHISSVADDVMPAVETGLLTFDGRTLGFRHELARLAVLESLPLLRVQEVHRAVLTTLAEAPSKPGVLARLVTMPSAPQIRAACSGFAPQAAQQAAAVGAHREAASHYRTALAWTEGLDIETRAALLDQLGYVCHLTGDMLAARDARTEALGLWRELDDTRAIGRDLRWLSRLAWFIGDTEEAGRRAKESLDVLAPLGDDAQRGMALSNRSQLHMLAREHDDCVRIGQRAIDMARRLGSVEVLTHALNNVGTSRANAGDIAGRALQEESLSLALDHDLHEHAARAFTNLVSSAVHARDYLYARRWLDRGITYAVERDLESWSLYLLTARARLLAETGRWPEAEADAKRVIDSPLGIAVARIPALTILGSCGRGNVLTARSSCSIARWRSRSRRTSPSVLCPSARLGPSSRCCRAVPKRRAPRPTPGSRSSRSLIAAGMASCCGTCTGARPAAPTDAGSSPRRRPTTARTACRCAGSGRPPRRPGAGLGCPYERADALAGGDVAAKEEALQVFLSLGAAAAADRVRQDLRRVGVTRLQRGPRRAPASTRRVSRGGSRRFSSCSSGFEQRTPQIGERLFVSPKTVEHHVSAILGQPGSRRAPRPSTRLAAGAGWTSREPRPQNRAASERVDEGCHAIWSSGRLRTGLDCRCARKAPPPAPRSSGSTRKNR